MPHLLLEGIEEEFHILGINWLGDTAFKLVVEPSHHPLGLARWQFCVILDLIGVTIGALLARIVLLQCWPTGDSWD